jgi:hypothetical protein
MLGLVTMMFTDRYERWGDLAAGTMVIVEDRQALRGVVAVSEPGVAELAAALPVNFIATASLARAISAYVERRRLLGAGRRGEVARILGEPLCQKFGLPADTNHDLLLCAVYQHSFIAAAGSMAPRQSGRPNGGHDLETLTAAMLTSVDSPASVTAETGA